MTKRFSISVLFLLLISACSINLVSKKETAALQSVLNFAGGHVNLNMDYSYTTEHGKQTTAKIEVSNSELVTHYANLPGFIASGVAYTFYNALDSERHKITDVNVTVHADEHSTSEYDFSTELLDSVNMEMPKVNAVVNMLKKRDYDSLFNMYTADTSLIKVNRDTLETKLRQYDSAWGEIEQLNIRGFRKEKIGDNTVILYAGILKRKKENSQFMVRILVGEKRKYVGGIQYEIY